MLSTERPADCVAGASTRSAGSAAEVVARTEALVPVLRDRATAVDELRQMLPASVADLKAAGTARLFQPARFGGCEAPMRSGVEALVAVGRGCGSSAWCMVQHVTHNFMLSQWPDHGQHDIWDEDPACLVSGIFISACRPRPSRRGRLRAVGPLAAGQRRQYQRLVPVRRPHRGGGRRRRPLLRPAAQPDRDRRYLAVGRPERLGEQRRHRLGGVRSRASHAVDQASQGRSDARQCAQQEPALPHPELLHLRRLHERRLSRHRRIRDSNSISKASAAGSR